jgi:hypothetical protein
LSTTHSHSPYDKINIEYSSSVKQETFVNRVLPH